MTTAVMRHGGTDHSGSGRPIVLSLNCTEAVKYLKAENNILDGVFGVRVFRIDLELEMVDVYPSRADDNESMMLALLARYDTTGYRQMRDRIADPEWGVNECHSLLEDMLKDEESESTDGLRIEPAAVRVVLIEEHLVDRDSVLRSTLVPWLINAQFYKVRGPNYHGAPERIWHEPTESDSPQQQFTDDGVPICKACGERMREAGSVWVCENDAEVYVPSQD